MIDLIVVLVLIIFAITGYKKGLIQSAITLCSSIIALIVSFIVYPVINIILKATPLYTGIYTGISQRISGIDFGRGIQTQGSVIMENITWLPSFLTEQIKNNNNTAMYALLDVGTIQEYISTYVTNLIIGLIAILITWILLKVVLSGVLRMIGRIVECLPVISSVNRGGGFVFGLTKGILMISLIGLMIPLFITLPSFETLSQSIEASNITKWLYENNFIIMLYNYFVIGK